MNDEYISIIKDSISVKEAIIKDSDLLARMRKVIEVIIAALNNGRRLYFCGNGGSAADAQHLAAELPVDFI